MNYQETLDFLFSYLPAYHRIGKAAYKANLDNTLELDKYFGSPHKSYKTIHIAGTNGKGSTSHMLASVLQDAGYTTGLYTSPHLVDFRERIKVNGNMISEDEVVEFVGRHFKIIEKIQPSFFEITVAMAFLHFKKNICDVAVIESGLGGRLDSTNIITPELSVITNIGHDHMDILGDTLSKVAAEKAGIIKKDIPVVIGESHTETRSVFISKAETCGSEIVFADERYKCSLGEFDRSLVKRSFSVQEINSQKIYYGAIPLGGDYQIKNIQTVFSAIDFLGKGFRISEVNLLSGIANVIENTSLLGRWQVLKVKPLMICDTGHNKEGLQFVMNQISRIKIKRLHIVIGFVNDKDLNSVLPVFPSNAVYYFTKASVQRALDENKLKTEAMKFGLYGQSYPDVKSAVREAEKLCDEDDMIFIGGSTFVVADIL